MDKQEIENANIFLFHWTSLEGRKKHNEDQRLFLEVQLSHVIVT